jgi:hypothetical protein
MNRCGENEGKVNYSFFYSKLIIRCYFQAVCLPELYSSSIFIPEDFGESEDESFLNDKFNDTSSK